MKADGNAVSISDAVRAELPELASRLGGDTELTVVFDQAPSVQDSIHGLTTEGLLGLGMAVVVILVFLLSVRSTLVTAVSIPLSVLVALIGLWAGGYSLNILTLGALTIAVGRVVDDSIVVLENIKRHLGYGEERLPAIVSAVREVAAAVSASTLTTVAVFAPIAFVSGMIGQLFRPFAVTVVVALLASLLVALTVIPVLAYWFLKPPANPVDSDTFRAEVEEKERGGYLQRGYLPVIEWAISHRRTTVAAALALVLGTVALVPLLKTNFLGDSGPDGLQLTQTMPVGTSLAATDAAAAKIEKVIAGLPQVTSYQVTVGGSSGVFDRGSAPASNTATYQVSTRKGTDRTALRSEVRRRVAGLDGVGKVTVGAGRGGLDSGALAVVVQASDPNTLASAAKKVSAAMAAVPHVVDVTSDLTATTPQVQVTVKPEGAARHGLTQSSIGQFVSQALRGTTATQVTIDGSTQDVVLRGNAPDSIDAIRALRIPTATGPVSLGEVADVAEVEGPAQVSHVDGVRSATITGTATGADTGAASKELSTRLAALDLPAGATYTIGGVTADQSTAFAGLGLAMVAAILLVFLVMVATFRSVVQPLVLLVSIPFAATGALLLLVVTRTPLGVAAMIGLLMLIGIVVTNAIVLMDLVNQYRQQGMTVRKAVVEGGRRRLRPILMTALATIFALLPMALGITGGGAFISQPLAVVVIGGLVSSTALTLVLVPTLYAMVETRRERRRDRAAAAAVRAVAGQPTGTDPAATTTDGIEVPPAPGVLVAPWRTGNSA